MRNTLDIAWLAGLLEGEGCFRIHRNSPGITLNMTDQDVVNRAANLLGIPEPKHSTQQRPNTKPIWCLALHGSHAVAWMMTLYSFMGSRRRARIEEIIKTWKEYKSRRYSTKGLQIMATCHPEKRAHAKLLCRLCYNRTLIAKYKTNPVWVEIQRTRKRKWEIAQRAVQ